VIALTDALRCRKLFTVALAASASFCACGNDGHQPPSGPGNCRPGDSVCGGDISVKLDVNRCPSLLFLYVAPSRVSVGKKATFAGMLSDPDGDQVVQFWTATGGRLTSEGSSPEVDTFTCLEPGVQTLTLWYSDTRGCSGDESMDVDCASAEDAGG
jgi:hypothetical protein